MAKPTPTPVLEISPLIAKVEEVHGIKDQLWKLGYRSVFDMVREPRSEFVRKAAMQFGRDTVDIYDLAIGYAVQVARAYREQRLVRGGGAESGIGAFALVEGPTYQDQFQEDWLNFAVNGAPEANDSPVAYLAYIYGLALALEAGGDVAAIKLGERRPDLAKLTIDADSISRPRPLLEIVNGVLEQSIGDLKPSVDEVLATTRYPWTLPYDRAHQQVLLALADAKLSLYELLEQAAPGLPAFLASELKGKLSDTMKILGSDLSIEQRQIVSGTPDSTPGYLSKIYGINDKEIDDLFRSSVLCERTELTLRRLEAALCPEINASWGGGDSRWV